MTTYNVTVVRRWAEVATPEDISNAINIPSPIGTALCMAAALKKGHEIGNIDVLHFSFLHDIFWTNDFCLTRDFGTQSCIVLS